MFFSAFNSSVRVSESRMLGFAAEAPKHSDENLEQGTASSFLTRNKAELITKHFDSDRKALADENEKRKSFRDQLRKARTEQSGEKKDEAAIRIIRSAINDALSRMTTLSGSVSGLQAEADAKPTGFFRSRYPINFQARMSAHRRFIAEMQLALKEFGADDATNLIVKQKQFNKRFDQAKKRYQSDTDEVTAKRKKVENARDPLEDTTDKRSLYRCATDYHRGLQEDIETLVDENVPTEKALEWASLGIRQARQMHSSSIKGVEIEHSSFTNIFGLLNSYRSTVTKAEDTVSEIVDKHSNDNASSHEVAMAYLESTATVLGVLSENYNAVARRSVGTATVNEVIAQALDALEAMEANVQQVFPNNTIEGGLESLHTEGPEAARKEVQREVSEIRTLRDANNTSKTTLRDRIGKTMGDFLAKAKSFNGKEEAFLHDEAVVLEYLKGVDQLRALLPTDFGAPAPSEGEISLDSLPRGIGRLIAPYLTLRDKGVARTSEENEKFAKLEAQIVKKYSGDLRNSEKKPVDAFLRKKGLRIDEAAKKIVTALSISTGDESVEAGIEKVREISPALATLLTAVQQTFQKMTKQPNVDTATVVAPYDPSIALIEQKISSLETALERLKLADGSISQPAQTDPLAADFAELQRLSAQLEEQKAQQGKTHDMCQWLSGQLFPGGGNRVVCKGGRFCVPGMPLSLLQWKASLQGCDSSCIRSGLSAFDGFASFSPRWSETLMQRPRDVFRRLANGYEYAYHDHGSFTTPDAAQSHFKWSYRKFFS